MSQQRLIAIADILGFKETVLTTPLDQIINEHFRYMRRALHHTLGDLQGITGLPDDLPGLKRASGLGFEWFSDTIVLIVGRALVGAHQLEAAQKWSGGAVTTQAAAHLGTDARHYLTDRVPRSGQERDARDQRQHLTGRWAYINTSAAHSIPDET